MRAVLMVNCVFRLENGCESADRLVVKSHGLRRVGIFFSVPSREAETLCEKLLSILLRVRCIVWFSIGCIVDHVMLD
jgi:hypothetical protein